MARFMHAHGVDCGIEGCADGRETLGYFFGDGRRRTASGHGPTLPNPEGGDTWYHGARFSMHGEGDHNTEGYEAFDDEEPSPEEKHEWGGGKVTGPDRTSYEPGEHADKHWNTDLGAHFTSLKAVARGFAGGGGVRGMTAKPSMGRVLHAGLHMSNPAVFADEREMGAHAARWAHKEGYRFHSPFGDAKEPVNEDHYDELRHGNYWHEDEDGETPYEHLGNYSGAHPEHMVDIDKHGVQPRHTQEHLDQYLANHPNREEITTGWKNHLKSQGHDGILYGNTLEGPHGHACAITLDDTTIHHRKWEWLNEHDRDEYDPHGETYKPSTSGAGQWNQDWHSRDGRKPYQGSRRTASIPPKPEYDSALGYDENRRRDREWNSTVRRGLSLGHHTHEEAQAAGYGGTGHDSQGWKPLPKDLYHVTTNMAAVQNSGLKSRDELSQQQGMGLGGGESDTISFTDDKKAAENIHDALHEFHGVLNGKKTIRQMYDEAKRGEGADKPYDHMFSSIYPEGENDLALRAHSEGRKLERGFHRESEVPEGWKPVEGHSIGGGMHTAWTRPATEDEQLYHRASAYKAYAFGRAMNGGKDDPLFFDTDLKSFAKSDPKDFGVVKAHPKPGAQGYQLGSLGEWRTATGDAVELDRNHKQAIHEHIIDHFEPTERLFAPTKDHLDETLFDGQERMRPEVRKEILKVTDHFFDTHGYTGHERWARVFLAGSQASYWGGNHDFDLLIGINYPIFRQVHPELDHLSDAEVDRHFNEQLRDDFNMDGWRPLFDPHGEPWDRTGYVNHASFNIADIKPYAAYNVTDDVWAVRPIKEPEGHEFVTTEWYYFEGVAAQILAAMKLQEPARTQTLTHIWDWVHGDRSRAFGPNGTGAFDRSNALEKYLSQYPAPGHPDGVYLMDLLRDAKYGLQATASRVAMAAADDDWRMQHRPPGRDGIPLHDMTVNLPADVYTHPHYYADMSDPSTQDSVSTMRRVRGKPDAKVKVYRALPAEHAHKGIGPGDWVTTSKEYARIHGRQSDPKHDWPVISATVRAGDLHTDGDDFREYGYNGDKSLSGNIAHKGGYHQEVSQKADGTISPVVRRSQSPVKGYDVRHDPQEFDDYIAGRGGITARDPQGNYAGHMRWDEDGVFSQNVHEDHQHVADHLIRKMRQQLPKIHRQAALSSDQPITKRANSDGPSTVEDDPARWGVGGWRDRDMSQSKLRETHTGSDGYTYHHAPGSLNGDDEGYGSIYVTHGDDPHNVVGESYYGPHSSLPERLELASRVAPDHRRRGVATGMYDFAERLTGKQTAPADSHSDQAAAFWSHRRASRGSVTINYLHNTERAPHPGDTYGQDIEPHGRYLIEGYQGRTASAGDVQYISHQELRNMYSGDYDAPMGKAHGSMLRDWRDYKNGELDEGDIHSGELEHGGPTAHIRHLQEDIAQNGLKDPLVIRGGNVVVDGNHRGVAALNLRLDKIPVRHVAHRKEGSDDMATKSAYTTRQRRIAMPWFNNNDGVNPSHAKSVRDAGYAGYVGDSERDEELGHGGHEDEFDEDMWDRVAPEPTHEEQHHMDEHGEYPDSYYERHDEAYGEAQHRKAQEDEMDHDDPELHHFIGEHGSNSALWKEKGTFGKVNIKDQPVYATQSHVNQQHIDHYTASPGDISHSMRNTPGYGQRHAQDPYLADEHPMFVTHEGRLHVTDGHHRVAAALQSGQKHIMGWHYDGDEQGFPDEDEGGWGHHTSSRVQRRPELLSLSAYAKLVLVAEDEDTHTREGVTHAGLIVKANDTGRVVVLQRSYKDEEDPARGMLEFPGGGIEPGESAYQAACREWQEETGAHLPEGDPSGSFISNGLYKGFIMVVPSEDDVDIHEAAVHSNPDDPFRLDPEVVMWIDIEHLADGPATRSEVKSGTDWDMLREAAL